MPASSLRFEGIGVWSGCEAASPVPASEWRARPCGSGPPPNPHTPAPEKPMTDVQGRCPACGGDSLFLGEGGHVTCSRLDCPNPCAADDMLGEGAPMLHRLAVLASDLFMAGKPGPERETARKFLEALQRPEPRLLACGFCYEEQGEEVHPHPECPEGATARCSCGSTKIGRASCRERGEVAVGAVSYHRH